MPDYTYPFIFPNLQENPRDLEVWLSGNTISQNEGDEVWAAATHQHADAIRISSTLDAGGSVPTSEGELGYVEISEGLSADQDVLLDVTVHVEVQNVPAGQYWGCRAGVQSVAQGVLLYHQGQAHTHSGSGSGVSVSGTAAADGAHSHSIDFMSDTATSSHDHGVGSFAVGAASGNTGSESSHIHSGPSHFHSAGTYFDSVDWHAIAGVSGNAGTGNTGAGSSHAHSLNAHTHGLSGQSSQGGSVHKHSVTGSTYGASAHTHTVSGTTGSIYVSVASGGGGLSKDMIPVRYVGTVNTGPGGTIRLSAHAVCPGSGATWTKISFVGAIWVVPSVLASQLGGLDDIADVSTPAPTDGQVLTWSAPANSWIAETAAASTGGWAGRMLLMGG